MGVFSFRAKKSFGQAFLFYICFVVLTFLIGMVYSAIFLRPEVTPASFEEGFRLGMEMAKKDRFLPFLSVLIPFGFGIAIINAKTSFSKAGHWLLLVLATALGPLFGGLLSGILLAVLTAREPVEKSVVQVRGRP